MADVREQDGRQAPGRDGAGGRAKPQAHAPPGRELEARARQQETVALLGQLALASDNLQTLLDEAARRVAATFGADFAKILELAPDGRTLRLRAGTGWRPGLIGRAEVSAGVDAQAGFTLLADEPVVVQDLRAEKRFPGSELLRAHGVVSGLSVVIPGHPRPFGVLGVHTRRRREFSTQDVHFLRSVANVVAAAARNLQAAQAVRDSEARTRAILETAVDGIVTIDERGLIDSVNPAVQRLFGYTAGELISRNVSVLMPEPFHSEHDDYLRRYVATGVPRIIGIGREVVGRRKDGTTFPVDLAVSEFVLNGRRMFTGLLHDVTVRRRLERQILEATAEEQRRIGQDLHDGLCQHLAGVAFAVEVLGQKLASRKAPEATTLTRISDVVDQAITQARDLARGLQPVALDAAGLEMALAELSHNVEKLFHVTCIFARDGALDADACGGDVASHLYRIAQEAISNAIKHGKARTIHLDLSADKATLRLTVSDDGTGISSAAPHSGGIGLQTMAYRARVIGGTLTVRSGTRGGTVVTCSVPLASRAVAAGSPTRQNADHGGTQTSPTDRFEESEGVGVKPDEPKRGGGGPRRARPAKKGARRRRSPDRP